MITAHWHWTFYVLAVFAVGGLVFYAGRSLEREEKKNDRVGGVDWRKRTIGSHLAGMPLRMEEDDGHSQKLAVDVEFPPGTFDPQVTLTDGSPVTADHRDLLPNGMQKGYVVLSAEERAKGFVRPVRTGYFHVGLPGPVDPLRDLYRHEIESFATGARVYAPEDMPTKFEQHIDGAGGKFWSQKDLDAAGRGCGRETIMGDALAETYARNPSFYSGTFCATCRKHFPVGTDGEFVWSGTDERVGT